MKKDLLEKAIKLYSEGKVEESLSILDRILEEGANLDAAIWKANILMSSGDFEGAISFFSSKEDVFGSNPMFWTQLGYLNLMRERPEEALLNFDKAISMDENFFYAYLGKGYAHYVLMTKFAYQGSEDAEEHFEKGLNALEKAKEKGAQESDVEILKGMMYEGAGKFEEAWKSYMRAKEIGSEDALVRLRALAVGIGELEKIKEAFGENPQEMIKEGIKLELSGDEIGALNLYYSAIKMGKGTELGKRALEMASSFGKIEIFEDLLNELSLSLDDKDIKRKYGECLIRGGKLKEGIKTLEEVRESFKGDPHFMGFLAFSYYDAGNEPKAIETLLENIEVSKDSPDPWLYLSLFHFDKGEFRGAKEAAEEALKRKPEMAEARYLIMLCKKKLGEDYSEEEEWLKEKGVYNTLSEYFGEDMRGNREVFIPPQYF